MDEISVIDGAGKPIRNPASVARVTMLERRGPWPSKSSGGLHVLLGMPLQGLEALFTYNPEELQRLPEDIRGLRLYTVSNVPACKVGGGHYHRIRKEIIYTLSGAFEFECEDVWGSKHSYTIDHNQGLYLPEFMLHNYKCLDDGGFLVIANTLFNPTDPRTHDNFDAQQFRDLQRLYRR